MPIISPKIPSGLEELMRGLAKSVIKENPQNIYEFAAEYFENLLKERDGSVDQSYKKFATYKVYKKNKSERLKREKENSNDVNEKHPDGLVNNEISVNYKNQKDLDNAASSEEKSVEEVILPPSSFSHKRTSLSSEYKENALLEEEAPIEIECVPPQTGNSEDDDVANMVFDGDMEQAALKIQSTFRGLKVRREMKGTVTGVDGVDDTQGNVEEVSDMSALEIREPDDIETIELSETELGVVESAIKQSKAEEVIESKKNLDSREEIKQSSVEKVLDSESAPSGQENKVEETSDQPDEFEVEQSNGQENVKSNSKPLDDEAEKEKNLPSEHFDDDEKTEVEEIDVQQFENENKIDILVEVSEEAKEEIINTEMTTEAVEPDTQESVIDTEAQNEKFEISSENNPTEVANDVEEDCDVVIEGASANNLNDQPETVVEDVTEANEPVNESIEGTAEEGIESHEISDYGKVEVNEQEELNKLPKEKEGINNIEAEEFLSTIESQETEKDEIGEQEILELKDDSNSTVVTPKSFIEETKQGEGELLPQAVEENAAVKSQGGDKLENKSNDSKPEELTEVTCTEEHQDTENTFNDEEIELTENIGSCKIVKETVNENVISDNKPQENDLIKGTDNEVTEQELLEKLNELPNENGNVDDIEASQVLHYNDEEGETSVIEEICVRKSIENLELNQENYESEIHASATEDNSLNEIENDQENLEDYQEKLLSGDIEYSTLKESFSEQAESADEVDNKSRDITDEKSIDGDTTGSKQNSLDEIQDEVNEQPHEEKHGQSFVHSSTVEDDEMNAIQKSEELEKGLNEAAEKPDSVAVESILELETLPIELVNDEYAGAVTSELFIDNIEELEREKDLIKSLEGEEGENPNVETIQPKLSKENPLQGIETQSFIDLSIENVQISQDEQQPITDEILQPEKEDSEIPDESQAPTDDNVPIVSIEDKVLSIENDEQPLDDNFAENPTVEDDVSDMILHEEMEDAALRIQAVLQGQRNENTENVDDEESNNVETIVVIDQCSDENQETEEQVETDQQDTSADVEQIQDSETVDQEQTEEETHEEENTEEETAVESGENDTTEHVEDDPNDTAEEGAAESSEQPQNNDDDDVANMVLDEEMEQAALKIQSTFRGHKTRQDMKKSEPEHEASASEKPREQKDPVQDVDDEIANMVLDDEMEQAALKIQSTFRGHKTRKDMKKDDETDEEKKEDEPKEEAASQSSSTEKTAKQLQDEEDVANLVMDAEMEQTALKIQSAFRGKTRKKAAKDDNESTATSASDYSDNDEQEEMPAKTEDDPFQPSEISQEQIGGGENSNDENGSENLATRYSPSDDVRYSIDCQNTSGDYDPLAINSSADDLNLMQGGGIFPEPSAESSEMLTGSSGDDRDPERNSSYEKVPSNNSSEIDEPISENKSVNPLNDEKVIENFDFAANKDTAEAMYYSLKKNELETQKQLSAERQLSLGKQLSEMEETFSMETMTNLENQSIEIEEDDDDVVVGAIQPSKRLKYGMSMDDRLLGSILSQVDYSSKARKDGVYPDDGFDPLFEATMRNHHFLEKLHEVSNSDEDKNLSYDDYPGDDEDQFDDFYNSNNIRQKIMASSISIADSDFFDPTSNKSIIDDDKIRTAIDKLETIPSSDSESTIASAATKIQVGDRMNAGRNIITSHNMQYSSIGNAAIDRSLDEFIQSQELRIDRFDEELEGYNSPPPRKQESVDEWTDTDSDKKVGSGIIEIKLEQKSFLTVDERRRTLHREDAIQRNSTRDDEDSSKSSNVSGEKLIEKINSAIEIEVSHIAQQDSVIDTEIAVPVLDLTAKSKSPNTASLVKPQRMKRQHTMPVQIQTDVIRVIPKHLRKRIKSADDDKKKGVSK